jgi:hypothetical protein
MRGFGPYSQVFCREKQEYLCAFASLNESFWLRAKFALFVSPTLLDVVKECMRGLKTAGAFCKGPDAGVV